MTADKSSNSIKYRWLQGTIAVVIILSAQLFASQIDGPTPKDSYLVHQVSSVRELVAEIAHHPFIRERYAELYHVAGLKVENYMSKNLVLSTLSHNYTHIVYCITPGGVVFTALETQHAGDKVFALRTGTPVLRWACGNPFTSTLPEPPGVVIFTGRGQHRPKATLMSYESQKPVYISSANVPDTGDGNSIVTEKVSSYLGSLPTTGTVTNIIEPAITGGSKIIPILPFVPLVPIAATTVGGSTGGSGGSTSSSTGGSTSGTTSGTSSGTTSGTSSGTTSGSSGGATTGTTTSGTTSGTTVGTSSGTSSGTSEGTTSGSTTGTSAGTTTTGGPNVTPEPGQVTIWSVAGLFLAVGAGVGRRKRTARAANL